MTRHSSSAVDLPDGPDIGYTVACLRRRQPPKSKAFECCLSLSSKTDWKFSAGLAYLIVHSAIRKAFQMFLMKVSGKHLLPENLVNAPKVKYWGSHTRIWKFSYCSTWRNNCDYYCYTCAQCDQSEISWMLSVGLGNPDFLLGCRPCL